MRGRGRRPWRWALAAGVLVVALLGLRLASVLGRELTPARLAERIESSTDAQVEIASVERTGSWLRPHLRVTGVSMRPRAAGAGQPPLLEVGELEADVRVWPLLWRRIEVARLVVRAAQVRARLAADGGNDFLEMFSGASGGQSGEQRRVRRSERLRFVAALDEVRVIDSSADVELAKSNLRVSLVGLNAGLDAIEVDPDNLGAMNTARLELNGVVKVHELERPAELGRIELSGPAAVRLFDPATSELSPDAEGRLTVGPGSYLSTRLPLFARSWGKLDAIRNLGVGVPLVPERLELTDGAVALRYQNGGWELREPLHGALDGWLLVLENGFSLNPGADTQRGTLRVYPTEQWAASFIDSVTGMLGKVSAALGSDSGRQLRENWYEDGRMVIILDSKGSVASPDISLRNELPVGKDLLKEELKEAGKGLLERLFDKGGN